MRVLYKRGLVYWYNFRWSIKLPDGGIELYRIRQTARTHNKKEAGEAENEHKRALRLGEIHPNDPWPRPEAKAIPTLRAFSGEFIEHTRTIRKVGTLVFYRTCLDRLLNVAVIADAPLDTITSDLVARYARYRRETAKSSAVTVNADVRTLRRMLHLAAEWGRIPFAPIVHELPQGKGRDRVLSSDEEARYLAVATENLRDMTILAVDTGMRPNGELFPLRWADVDLDGRTLSVRDGKTDSAARSIPLTPRAAAVLQGRKAAKRGTSPYVFPGAGRKGHIATIQHPHEKALIDAKLPAFPFYCWRHTFGTRAAMSGMDRFSLARLMGHSSPAVAEKYYIHVTGPHVAAGFERFVEYLSGPVHNPVHSPERKEAKSLIQ